MPAYLIVTREEPIQDADAFNEYQSRTRKMTGEHKLTPRVVYGDITSLEGTKPDGMVMLEFPSVEEAEAWYNDPQYQEALPFRLKSSSYRAFIVEGFQPPK
ncbi:DUF1330 domain-containing protein [Pseudomaricurvus sp.]|uniref:DUF1330 domain-containing protein n=1 Tax=Pseudomaricurvus sp. TaxID=2004510 RepID=UPI003F6D9310